MDVDIQTWNLELESSFSNSAWMSLARRNGIEGHFHGIQLQLNPPTFNSEFNPFVLERIQRTNQSQLGLAPRLPSALGGTAHHRCRWFTTIKPATAQRPPLPIAVARDGLGYPLERSLLSSLRPPSLYPSIPVTTQVKETSLTKRKAGGDLADGEEG